MKQKTLNSIGWILLLMTGVSWIIFGYLSWYLLTVPLAYISFTMSEGGLEKMKIWKKISAKQLILIAGSFILSVAVAFGLIQAANYLINEVFHLSGWIRTLSRFAGVVLALYPVKILFGTVVYKVIEELQENKPDESEG